ncbi:MAG: AAA family ATPase [bacterium]|nr:AAA family ATPase [bacterium]
MLPMNVLVTGSPCTGKTTTARLLAKKLGYKYISLLELAQLLGTVEGYDEHYKEFIVDETLLEERIKEWIKNKQGYVIEALFPDLFPPESIAYVFVLRAHPKTLEKRMREKGYPEDKIIDNLRAEMYDWCLLRAIEHFGQEKVHEIYTEGMTPEQVVEEMLQVLRGKKRPRIYENLPFSSDFYKYL